MGPPAVENAGVWFWPGPIPILHLTFQPDHGREEQVRVPGDAQAGFTGWVENESDEFVVFTITIKIENNIN